jgi:catechol 1,2-dioxygenase
VAGPWYSLDHAFTIEAGEARLPRAPISAKTDGPKPQLARLERR